MLLSEAIEALLIATRVDGGTPATVRSYRQKLKPLPIFLGDVEVGQITADDLRRFMAHLMDRPSRWQSHPKHRPQKGGLSPFTIAGHGRALKRLFNWLEAEGELSDNPVRRIRIQQPKRREPKGISLEDFLTLLNTTEGDRVADSRDRAILLFLTDTGCRVGGLCGLEVQDVDLDAGLALLMEKGEKARFAPFSRPTADAIRAWLAVRPEDAGPHLFVSLGNKAQGALTPNGVRQMLGRRARRAGVTGAVNPHAFRHGFAREFLMDGGDLATLADLLGHSSVEVTKASYAIFTVQELQEKHRRHSPVARLLGGSRDAGS